MATAARDEPGLLERLAAIPEADLLTDAADRCFFGTDVFRAGAVPIAVARPRSVEALQAVVAACAEARAPIAVRGGGASYTDGYTHALEGGVTLDMSGLNRIMVDATNGIVTAEAGATWAQLRDALLPHGLRTPFFGPFSGLAATVGGSMSQHAISHGTGLWGVSADSLVGLDVVTGTGDLLTTGAPHFRHYGPDLAGLFTGDCGALGVKARVRLRLIRRREHFAAASFSLADFAAMHAAMREVGLEALDDENFGLDATLQQGQIGRNEGVAQKAEIAKQVLKGANSLGAGVRALAKMAAAGDRALRAASYAVHYIVEGVSQREAEDRAARIRAIFAAHGAEPIPETVPTVVRSMPFAPLTNILGPAGERWVPFHAILPHDQVGPFHAALEAYLADNAGAMATHGITSGRMFMAIQGHGFVYEPTFYWPDAQTIYHERMLPAEHQKTIRHFPENPAAAAEVMRMKAAIVDLMQAHGAAHLQVGKVYPWAASRDAATRALVQALKATLDPHGILSPGVLGL
ncbi:MAG: FAD-binding oxidoreductase [Sphingomonadaceae bacterium]